MVDRRRPYRRTLAVLRVLAWPYQYPPLSWMVALNGWLTATRFRIAATAVVGVAAVVWAVITNA